MKRPHVLIPFTAAAAALVIAAPQAHELAQTAPASVGPGPAVVDHPETEAPTQPGATAIGPATTVDEGRGASVAVPAPSTIPANSVANGPLPVDVSSRGTATWYATPWGGLTAASRDYPRGTRLRVCHGARCVGVVVNDYGPEVWTGHALDLSSDAFAALAPLGAGVIDVTWVVA